MRTSSLAFVFLLACGGPEQPRTTTPEETTSTPTSESTEATLRCASDDDCTVVGAVCPGWQAVNVASRDSVIAQTRALQAVASCMALTTPLPPTTVQCADAQCVLVELEHPEWRACASPTDCVAVEAVCGGADAAAVGSADAMRASYAEMAMRVRCARREPVPTTPDCRAGLCVPR